MLRMLFSRRSAPIKITNLNDKYLSYYSLLEGASHTKIKLSSVKRKVLRSNGRLFVIDFKGDVLATNAASMSEEISAILSSASAKDEVLVRVESPGGAVHSYGYAMSQLKRITDNGIKLTVSIDKVAASGGYMMACVADKVICAPYAIVGSIGVVSEFLNFNRILEKFGVDYKQYTAGKYKRTVSNLGPITEEGEAKFKTDLERVYVLFKEHVLKNRKELDLEEVATGEYWYGIDALEKKLVDQVCTSEEFIQKMVNEKEVLHIKYAPQVPFANKIRVSLLKLMSEAFISIVSDVNNMRY